MHIVMTKKHLLDITETVNFCELTGIIRLTVIV